MPTAERLLPLLHRAVELTRLTPGRAGHLVDLANPSDVLIIGDLHGHVPNFQSIWKRADLANHPRRHLVLQELIHGKFVYPTGGERSHQLVDLFAAIKCQYPDRVHYLPGNHELSQWTGRPILKGEANLSEEYARGVATAYGAATADVVEAYRELWKASPLALRTPNQVFISHTIVPGKQFSTFDPQQLELDEYDPDSFLPGGVAYGMVWGRDTTPAHVVAFLRSVRCKWLITGHFPADDGFTIPNDFQLTLDCSANPGGYSLIPADRPLQLADLVKSVTVI
ncbi:MAG: metallophosphoesterase [Gemmataceae bacterium]